MYAAEASFVFLILPVFTERPSFPKTIRHKKLGRMSIFQNKLNTTLNLRLTTKEKFKRSLNRTFISTRTFSGSVENFHCQRQT